MVFDHCGRHYDLRPYGPGKYDFIVDAILDVVYFTEDCGSIDSGSHIYKLIDSALDPDEIREAELLTGISLTDDERAFLTGLSGVIIVTDTYGFVTVEHFLDADALQKAWKHVTENDVLLDDRMSERDDSPDDPPDDSPEYICQDLY